MEKFFWKGRPVRNGKWCLSMLMCLCLIGTMVPISARAESGNTATPKTINLDATVLRPEGTWSLGGNMVYFGTYEGNSLAYRVLASPST